MRPIPLHFTPPQRCRRLAEARHVVVDGDDARHQLALQPPRRLLASRPAARGEAVRAVVREPDGLVERVHRQDRQHGPEGLLAQDRHRVVHVHQDGGRVEEAGARGGRASGQRAGALRQRVCHVLLDRPSLPLEGERAHLAASPLHGPLQRAGLLEHLREEGVLHLLLDVDPLDRGAGLSRVHEGGPHDALRRPVEVGVAADDRRVLAAELQEDRGQVPRRRGHDLLPGGDAAGEDDLPDPWVLDQARRDGVVGGQDAQDAVREARLLRERAEPQAGERRRRGGLEQDGVPGHERRGHHRE